MEIECTVRDWGNSLGITIPKEIARKAQIKSGEKIKIEIKKREGLQAIYGILKKKGVHVDGQKMKDELREEWNW
ncbi:AbrB/MazE/SpoVT family DNA-binding domain-containing protein [Candidatus Woesearchaeota archaeon]|nr:MAG: AbrB/MazE/SpoVT family DNA-binding domain-containing protein [Candidatus Woesearchaeota archaeon]